MQQFLPNTKLQPYIKRYMVMESDHGMINTLLPDTSMVMALRYKGMVKNIPSVAVTGIRKSFRVVEYAANTGVVLVIFKEGGAAAFFKEPLHEFFDLSVPLEVAYVEEQLAGAIDNQQRIAIVERFLDSTLQQTAVDALILDAIEQIQHARGDIRVKELLRHYPVSRDPFEKRFRRITGTSPKHFASIIRLRHVIGRYSSAVNLTDAAHSAGYFDQAHFIKDFRAFTGQSPQQFFKSPLYW